jgi:uncharacterized alkaline shock family protein YloU
MEENTYGKTTIAPEVLISITQLATLGVEGVSRLVPAPREVNTLFKKGVNEGIDIVVENNVVFADIFVALKHDVVVRDVAKNIQNQVSRSISEMVGLDIGQINVHVEEIE